MWMAEGRGKAEWGRMSALLAMLANINRDPKKSSPAKPTDFNPFSPKKSRIENLSELKGFFVPGEVADEEIGTLDFGMVGSGSGGTDLSRAAGESQAQGQ
jgi:hypothetical protein